MKCIPQTHKKLGCVEHTIARLYRDGGAAQDADAVAPPGDAPAGTYNTCIAPEIVEAQGGMAAAVDLACEPGDVVLFSNLLFHRGGFNTSGVVRWSVDWRYQDVARPTHRPRQGHVLRTRMSPAPSSVCTGAAAEGANVTVVASCPGDWGSLGLT